MPLQKTCGTKTVWLLHLSPFPHRLLSEEQTRRSLYSFYVHCGSISHGLVIRWWNMLLWKHYKYHLLSFSFEMPIILLVTSISDTYVSQEMVNKNIKMYWNEFAHLQQKKHCAYIHETQILCQKKTKKKQMKMLTIVLTNWFNNPQSFEEGSRLKFLKCSKIHPNIRFSLWMNPWLASILLCAFGL